jgi:hypothetical protein
MFTDEEFSLIEKLLNDKIKDSKSACMPANKIRWTSGSLFDGTGIQWHSMECYEAEELLEKVRKM